MCLIAMISISYLLSHAGIALLVAIGLGAVIFVHELGHFLVAKACGVKCEKFFIGFDIGGYKLSHRWGETEYGIGILPLGGYVKMLGQDDDPAHIAEEMRRCEITPDSPNAVEITGPNGEKYHVDRRSYLAKSVPQRMAIISAGVVMNVIFAFIFAVVAYGMGVSYMPCIVSETVPGSPAWKAAIEPGDEVVQIGSTVNPTFTQLRGGVTLGDLKNGLPCVVHRASDGKDVTLILTPEQTHGLATVGIMGPKSLTLADGVAAIPGSPAAEAKLVEPTASSVGADAAKLQSSDEIVRVNNVAVTDFRAFASEVARHPDKPLQITVKRSPTPTDEPANASASPDSRESKEFTFEVPVQNWRSCGLVMKMGPITAVQTGSPAAVTGLKADDIIVAVDRQLLSSGDIGKPAWTPDNLPEVMRQAALAGKSVTLTVLRAHSSAESGTAASDNRAASPDDKDRQRLDITVTPRVPDQFYSAVPPIERAPMVAPALGITYRIENEVLAVVPGGPAASTGIEGGDHIVAAKFVLPKDATDLAGAEAVKLSDSDPNWPVLIEALQLMPAGTAIELTVQTGSEEHQEKITPVAAENVFVADRGFILQPIERIRKAETLAQQIRYGWDETTEALTMVFRFIQKVGTGQVPTSAFGGPITIATAAGYAAYQGLPQLLVFLTMLSANLAVINFLPIPLLDGGHIVFLAWEGLRRRPANEKFVVALHTAGFVFIISLMLYVIALDLHLLPRNL
jgi:regulator of sigma E protease